MKRTRLMLVRWFMLTVVVSFAGIPGCRRSEKAVKPTAQIPPQPTRATKATTLSKASAPSAEAVQHYQAGLKAKEAKDYATAADELSKAVKLSSDYADAHRALAWVCVARKEKGRAISEFQEVLRIAPEGEKATQAKEALRRLGSSAFVRSESVTQAHAPILLHVDENLWLPLESGTGNSWLTPVFQVQFTKKSYRGEKAVSVLQLASVEHEKKEGLMLRTVSLTKDETMVGEKGAFKLAYAELFSSRSYRGKGYLQVHLQDKKNGTRISNVVLIPLAVSDAAKKEFEKRFGPSPKP